MLLLLATVARADVYQLPSLDGLVDASEAVVHAEVATEAGGAGTLAVDTVASGVLGPSVDVVFGGDGPHTGDVGWFAVFAADRGSRHAVWIGHGQGGSLVVDADQRDVTDIEAHVRARAASGRHATAPLAVDPTPGLLARAPVGIDTLSSVLVPPDPERWPLVETWLASPDWRTRVRGVRALPLYPGPRSEHHVRRLLADPETVEGGTARWPVRLYAWEAALTMGLDVAEPEWRAP